MFNRSVIWSLDTDGNHFRAVAPDDANWLTIVADEYVGLRAECALPLTDVSLDGIRVVGVERLTERIRNATIPAFTTGDAPRTLSVIRSDFGETLCYMLMEHDHSTRFGYKSVRDRELTQLPGRGIDAVGIEAGPLTLVLGEVKVSNEDSSPPQVVDGSNDSLKRQHRGHLGDLEATGKKIWDLARRATDKETQELFLQAALYFDERRWDKLRLVVCCFMVRPRDKYADTDFGSFRRSPADYGPAKVRFVVVCVPDDIETTVQSWYSTVQQTEVLGE